MTGTVHLHQQVFGNLDKARFVVILALLDKEGGAVVDSHIVQAGDTLSAIAHKHLGRANRWPQIYAYNVKHRLRGTPALRDPSRLVIGQHILLPPKTSLRPPHLPLHTSFNHPQQTTKPVVQPATQPAVASGKLPDAAPALPSNVTSSPPSGPTQINSFAYKYNLDLLPPIKDETPAFDYESKLTGQIYIWADKQIDLLTYGTSGMELAAKHETDTILGQLVNSGKVTWAPNRTK